MITTGTNLPIASRILPLAFTNSNNLGGPYTGYSAQQTSVMFKNSEDIMARRILRDAWNTQQARDSINGYGRQLTPFRAVNSLGDYLCRENYVCGGSNQVNADYPGWKGIIGCLNSVCDNTKVSGYTGNSRYVPDSSNYITFKKQVAMNRNYNELKNGGDSSNASQVALSAVRRY